MATTWWVISLVVAAVAIADQLLHEPSAWTAADRERGWWLGMTAVAGLLSLGIVAAVAYLVAVRWRFGGAPSGSGSFAKGAPRPPAPPPPADPARPEAPRGGRLVVELDDR